MAGLNHEQIQNLFGQHRMSGAVFAHFSEIKAKFEELALLMKTMIPDSPMQTITIRKLVEAKNEATLGYLTYVVEHPDEFPEGIITDEMIETELQEGKDYAAHLDVPSLEFVCVGTLTDKFGSPKAIRIIQAFLREMGEQKKKESEETSSRVKETLRGASKIVE